jgi:hypothetical protein
MDFVQAESRAQVSFGSLDELIPAEHQVRFLDVLWISSFVQGK